MDKTALIVGVTVFALFGLALFAAHRSKLPPLDPDWLATEARVDALPQPRNRIALWLTQYGALLLVLVAAARDERVLTFALTIVLVIVFFTRVLLAFRQAIRVGRARRGDQAET